jgi:hypothetical protein
MVNFQVQEVFHDLLSNVDNEARKVLFKTIAIGIKIIAAEEKN